MTKTLLTSALILGSAVASQASIIAVVNGDDGAFTFEDASTAGDTFAGLTGAFSVTSTAWAGGPDEDYWGTTMAGFLTGSAGDTATWTVTGYNIGQSVEVYAHWREIGQESNNPTDAAYSVNGGATVTGNQKVAPVADLTLNDGTNDLSFESLGVYTADGAGQIQVILSEGTDAAFTNVDAIAFETVVPEPSSAALLGLGGLALILRRRK